MSEHIVSNRKVTKKSSKKIEEHKPVEEQKLKEINDRIGIEICYDTLEELTDSKLMIEYKKCDYLNNLNNIIVSFFNYK